MVVAAKIQRVSILESAELDGAVTRLVTETRVVGLTDTDLAVLTNALAAVGIPLPGSTLPDYPDLILRERNTKLVDGEPGIVDVTLVYGHLVSPGQAILAPVTGSIAVRSSAKVQQLRTNVDLFGNTIKVEHTYPADDPDRPNEFKEIGGEVDFFQVMRNFTLQGNRTTNNPWLIANSIIGKLNATAWSGGEIHTWMCVGIEWNLIKSAGASSIYTFRFEFQHNPETWNPTVVFIDDRTSKPPVDLIKGKGFKTVRIHPATDFEEIVGSRIQGA